MSVNAVNTNTAGLTSHASDSAVVTSTTTLTSVAWKLRKFASKKRQKEMVYLSKFNEDAPLKGHCDTCNRTVKHRPARNDNDLIVKVIVMNGERYINIMVAPYVGDIIQDLTISDINALPIYKRRYPPRSRQLVESLYVEPYLGNSSTLYICRTLHDVDDFSRLSRSYLNTASAVGGDYVMFAMTQLDSDDGRGSNEGSSHEKCDLPTPIFPVTLKFPNSNGHQIECCQAMLALKSPVFARMFEPSLASRDVTEVMIDDCDYKTFYRFLQFVLIGEEVYLRTEGESLMRCAARLLPLASKYGVAALCEMCAVVLVDSISEERALATIDLLQEHYAGAKKHQLMTRTMSFIKEHPSVMNDAGKWNELATKYPELLRQVIITCL